MKYQIVGSIVLYKTDPEGALKAIQSFFNTQLQVKLYLVDNSPTDSLRVLANTHFLVEYIHMTDNVGFGSAHNIAIERSINESEFHLVLNPDVYFDSGTLEKLYEYARNNNEAGLLLPKVLSFDNELQFVCKRLPHPIDLIIRRFIPFKSLVQKRIASYEMQDKNYEAMFEASALSGCFMFIRTRVFKDVGKFDERYFMYMEDIDLSRRIAAKYKTFYYPEAIIHHGHARASYRINKLLLIHAIPAVKYFNKWGWLFDRERKNNWIDAS